MVCALCVVINKRKEAIRFLFISKIPFYLLYHSSLNLTLTFRFCRSGLSLNSAFLLGIKVRPLKLRKFGNSFSAILKNSSSSSLTRFPRTFKEVNFLKTKSLSSSERFRIKLWPMSRI